jgi:hypothetical protein
MCRLRTVHRLGEGHVDAKRYAVEIRDELCFGSASVTVVWYSLSVDHRMAQIRGHLEWMRAEMGGPF